ncbi:hypothetical protein J7M28_10055 [bacterium]|nr:hypothetical protein [bacterium]
MSHDEALKKAREEYDVYRKGLLKEPSAVEQHFAEAVKEAKWLERSKKDEG